MTGSGTARFGRYADAKARLSEALAEYLTAVVEIGGEDAAASLELARQMLVRDLHAAVDGQLSTVPLTDVWTHLTEQTDRAGDRMESE